MGEVPPAASQNHEQNGGITTMHMKTPESNSPATHLGNFLKRMGLAGFTFFLSKGLLWLLVPWLAHSAMF